MTIAEAQASIDQWIKTYGVRYFNELTNMTVLTEEVGELARLMSRVYGEQSFKHKEDEEAAPQRIAEEMADILFVVICLANQMDINLEEALNKSIANKTSRDGKRHHDNKKLKNA